MKHFHYIITTFQYRPLFWDRSCVLPDKCSRRNGMVTRLQSVRNPTLVHVHHCDLRRIKKQKLGYIEIKKNSDVLKHLQIRIHLRINITWEFFITPLRSTLTPWRAYSVYNLITWHVHCCPQSNFIVIVILFKVLIL